MKILVFLLVLFAGQAHGQDIASKLGTAIGQLAKDDQLKHAIVSLYVVDGKTGKVIYDKNSQVGLAPASCQKVITSVTAFELLGKNYRYTTSLAKGSIKDGRLYGDLYIIGSGDPTLGSWRYSSTRERVVLAAFVSACNKLAPKGLQGKILSNEFSWGPQVTPDGWIWQDIGNYYGAGASALNWRENQFDIVLKSGQSICDPVTIQGTTPTRVYGLKVINGLSSAAKGSGDNAYIYLAPGSSNGYLLGTIPINEDRFTISGAYPDPAGLLKSELAEQLSVRITGGNSESNAASQFVDATNTTLASLPAARSVDVNASMLCRSEV